MAVVFSLPAGRGVAIRGGWLLAQPSLDDVFLHDTGRSLRDAGGSAGKSAGERVAA